MPEASVRESPITPRAGGHPAIPPLPPGPPPVTCDRPMKRPSVPKPSSSQKLRVLGHDARSLRTAGYDAVLVGETLVTAPDPAAALRALRVRV